MRVKRVVPTLLLLFVLTTPFFTHKGSGIILGKEGDFATGAVSTFALASTDQGWYVYDEITPSEDGVEWRERGERQQPLTEIAEKKWLNRWCRLHLVRSEHLFATLTERFNWTRVSRDLESEGQFYSTFSDFEGQITQDPSWWLSYSWQLNVQRFGIPLHETSVIITYSDETAIVLVQIFCPITNIPGFFISGFMASDRRLEPLLAGLSLQDVSLGSIETFDWFEGHNEEASTYRIYFRTYANLLSVYGDGYTFTLKGRAGSISSAEHEIKIVMPSTTQVQQVSPSEGAQYSENSAVFSITEGTAYPDAFIVMSSPPIKDFSQIFLENAMNWITDPSKWVTIGSLVAILYAAFNGKRLWDRRKTYYRLYRSMVKVYDRYAQDYPKFYQEIEQLSKSITHYFIENQINDDQLDKLLIRRDDLIARAQKMTTK